VPRLVNSALYKRQLAKAGTRPQPFVELEEKTGLNPERDVDLVLLAGTRKDSGVVMVRGRFDQYKVARLIETSKKGVVSRKHQGLPMYVHEEGSGRATAVAFLGDEVLVFGTQPAVEATINSHVAGTGGLKGNAGLIGLLEGVKPGSTVWMVGDQSLLAEMPKAIPGPGGSGSQDASPSTLPLPPLKSVVATGDLEPEVAFEVTAEAADEAGARNLADLVRGLVALGSLQASQKPELKGLATAVSVATEGNRVHLSARLPYELLDALQPKPSPRARPSGQ
jgi:hypothetical protein